MDKEQLSAALDHLFFRAEGISLAEVHALLQDGIHPDKIIRPEDKWPLLAFLSKLLFEQNTVPPIDEYGALYAELIQRGANVNRRLRGSNTPLSILLESFARSPQLADTILKLLLDAGADLSGCSDSPICKLIGFGSMKGEIYGWSFHFETHSEEADAFWRSVHQLIAAGVDINAFERRGLYNPLLMAADWGAVDAVRLLLDLGAEPNIVNKDGNTALMYAAGDADGLASIVAGICCSWSRTGDTLALTKLLLAQGADPSLKNNRNRTALSIALRNMCFDVAFELASALSAKGQLTKADLKAFSGSEFEVQAMQLPISAPRIKTPKPKDTSGESQLASWAKTLKDMEDEYRVMSPVPVFKILLNTPSQSYSSRLYADTGHMSFYLSTTKSCTSRKGALNAEYALNDVLEGIPRTLYLRYKRLDAEGMNFEVIAERSLPVNEHGIPNQEELLSVVDAMAFEYLNVAPLT